MEGWFLVMNEKSELYVLCVYSHNAHTSESYATKCSICGVGLWISPWHVLEEEERKPICIKCLVKVARTEEVKPCIDKRDLERAAEEIRKRKMENGRQND